MIHSTQDLRPTHEDHRTSLTRKRRTGVHPIGYYGRVRAPRRCRSARADRPIDLVPPGCLISNSGSPPDGRPADRDRARDLARAAGDGYGTAAVERWGVPVWVLQRLLGHTDSRTTQRYLHLDGSPEIAAAVRGISFRCPVRRNLRRAWRELRRSRPGSATDTRGGGRTRQRAAPGPPSLPGDCTGRAIPVQSQAASDPSPALPSGGPSPRSLATQRRRCWVIRPSSTCEGQALQAIVQAACTISRRSASADRLTFRSTFRAVRAAVRGARWCDSCHRAVLLPGGSAGSPARLKADRPETGGGA